MFRMILVVVFALIVGSGAIVVVAQGGTGHTEAPEAGAVGGCSTPVASSAATIIPGQVVASPAAEASPAVLIPGYVIASPAAEANGCATPEIGTPVSWSR